MASSKRAFWPMAGDSLSLRHLGSPRQIAGIAYLFLTILCIKLISSLYKMLKHFMFFTPSFFSDSEPFKSLGMGSCFSMGIKFQLYKMTKVWRSALHAVNLLYCTLNYLWQGRSYVISPHHDLLKRSFKPSYTADGNVNWCSPMENSMQVP